MSLKSKTVSILYLTSSQEESCVKPELYSDDDDDKYYNNKYYFKSFKISLISIFYY